MSHRGSYPQCNGANLKLLLWLQPDPSPASIAANPAAQPDDERQRLDEQVASFAAQAAAEEEKVFTSAMADMQQQASSTADTAQREGPNQPHRPPGSEKKAATDAASLRLAAMRRIEAARKYSASKGSAASSSAANAAPAPPSIPTAPAQQEEATEWGQSGIGSAQKVINHPQHAHLYTMQIYKLQCGGHWKCSACTPVTHDQR